MSRSLHRDQFIYRKLTDKPLGDRQATSAVTVQQQKTDDKLVVGQRNIMSIIAAVYIRYYKSPQSALSSVVSACNFI